MDSHLWAQTVPLLLVLVAALGMLVLGREVLRRIGPWRMMRLQEAAKAAAATAKRERMVIAKIAKEADDGQLTWYARSIAGVVPVYRAAGLRSFEEFAGNIGAEWQSLYIEKRDYPTYLRWARSMQ